MKNTIEQEEKQSDNSSETEETVKGESAFKSFDEFLQSQPEDIRGLYETTVSGLKNALDSERDNRKKLAEQVKALSTQAEKGSELEKQLTETVKLLQEAEQREAESKRQAKFAEQAIRPEVSCGNVKAAYALAVAEGLFSEQGEPDWKKLRSIAPELFRLNRTTDAGNTGKSTTSEDMNAVIRRQAGL